MSDFETEELFAKGVMAVDRGNWLVALSCFEKIVQEDGRTASLSYFAVCIARERGLFNTAEALCREAIEKDAENPLHYLNLGRVFLYQGRKMEAIGTFREGLHFSADKRLIDELNRLGTRKKPVVPFLGRDNPINKYLGILMTKLKMR
ncbi:MAG TPA: tetratricopeptide repeat protein [Geobacteraceae bacterium]|nr:tetratricopeptide repeat protein [Geobacteraceae bacterium]